MQSIHDTIGKLCGGKLLDKPQEFTACCDKHGQYAAKQFFAHVTPACPRCLNEQVRAQTEQLQREMAEHNRRQAEVLKRQALCESTDIPPRFADKTVKSWLPETDSEQITLSGIVRYVQSLRSGGCGSLVLYGNTGTGKTHLACALLAMVKRDLGGSVQYLTVGDFFRKVRESQNFRAAMNESAVLDFYEQFDLLVLDEVGNQLGGDVERVLLCELLNRRYAKMKPTVVVSNLDKQPLAECLGKVVWERLLDDGVQLKFDGRSRRKPLDWAAA